MHLPVLISITPAHPMVAHIRNSALGLSGKVKKGSILEILIKGLTYLHNKYAGLNIMFGFEWVG